MTRLLVALALLSLAFGTSGWLTAQDGGGTGSSTGPLDLPSGGNGGDEDEEDAPETISFYGGEYEGDGFFWCLDKSCSMGWAGDLDRLKTEMTEALNSLTDNSDFSIVAFSSGTTVFSQIPKEGTAGNRSAGVSWVTALTPDGATCLADAGVQCVNISNLSEKESKQVLILSDGAPNCPGPDETTSLITAANWQRTPINTIYISSDQSGITFMQQLAAANSGTFFQPPQ